MQKTVSILIPMKNEADGILTLFERLIPTLDTLPVNYEIIIINDGSTDNTLELLLQQQKIITPLKLKIIDLSRNFGKEAALYAGFAHCTGDCAIAIDADLQDPPELIPEMVDHWIAGHEIVTAVRDVRQTDTYIKRKSAGMFYKIINKISDTKLTPHAGDYRLLNRAAINAFLQLSERVRFNKGLFSWIGFKEKTIKHSRVERAVGKSKWSYWNLFRFSIDGITSFSKAPLEIWFYFGVIITIFGFIYALYYFLKTIIFGIDVSGYPSLLMFILFFSGLQITGIGILGKYIGRIFIESKNRPIYIVRNLYWINSTHQD